MEIQEIKEKIFKNSQGINNYTYVSIEEMDWCVDQAEKVDELNKELIIRKMYEGFLKSIIRSGGHFNEEHTFEWFRNWFENQLK